MSIYRVRAVVRRRWRPGRCVMVEGCASRVRACEGVLTGSSTGAVGVRFDLCCLGVKVKLLRPTVSSFTTASAGFLEKCIFDNDHQRKRKDGEVRNRTFRERAIQTPKKLYFVPPMLACCQVQNLLEGSLILHDCGTDLTTAATISSTATKLVFECLLTS
jgi:hypothetical protein